MINFEYVNSNLLIEFLKEITQIYENRKSFAWRISFIYRLNLQKYLLHYNYIYNYYPCSISYLFLFIFTPHLFNLYMLNFALLYFDYDLSK